MREGNREEEKMVGEEKRGGKRKCNGERYRDGKTETDHEGDSWRERKGGGGGERGEEGVKKRLNGCQEVGRQEGRTKVEGGDDDETGRENEERKHG